MFTKYGLTAALVLFVAGVVWAGTQGGTKTSQTDACKRVGDCCAKGGCCPDGGCCCKGGGCSCVVCECACGGNACCADHGAAKTTSDVKAVNAKTSQGAACKLVGDCCAKGGCCPDGGCCCKDGVCSCVVCECACGGNACCADHGAAKTTSEVKVIKSAKSTPACCKI